LVDPGTSFSDDSEEGELSRDSGMKAVVTLNKLHRKVKRHPRQIIKQFEKELLEELAVVPGQAWSIRDWLRRCCVRTSAVRRDQPSDCPTGAKH